ncbi:hypothetical protein PM038_00135 [Halorubrum ezzemoulense]|uniref:hypothetical protein n=1 Tax=Halorubrum ezzemoulense TaxID=337243 RepID=UPI00232D8D70|nr:hypothetical protein [Halorubrum ezzemoulense]MDB2283683.1 hypothetical protein [Halorubrum ezzemoulense]
MSDDESALNTPRSPIRRAVDGELLDPENPIDYLVGLLLEGKRYDGAWDGDETAVAKYAIASWCLEIGWVPDLRDYDPGEQVDFGDEVPYLDAAFYGRAVSSPSDGRGLPTVAYTTESGERRRVRYERVPDEPYRAERHVDRWDDDESEWVSCGGEPLAELVIDGEHRAAVTVTEGL